FITLAACGGGSATDGSTSGHGGEDTAVGTGGTSKTSATGAGGGMSDASASSVGGGMSTTSSTSASSSSSGGGQKPPQCVRSCAAAKDCVASGANPPFDEDNWACEAGACRWLGCLNDGECAFFGGVCRLDHVQFGGVKTCTEACNNSADQCVE